MAGRVWVGVGGVAIVAAAIAYFGIIRQAKPPAETPVVQTDPGKTETPAAGSGTAAQQTAPAASAEAPKVETAQTEPAKSEAVKTDPAKTEPTKTEPAKTEEPKTEAAKTEAPAAEAPKVEAPKAEAPKTEPAKPAVVPTFDVVRVEPTGDSVIAGAAAPGATVELLRNGESFSRTVADVGGQWAIVPSPLPAGSSTLALRTTSPEGAVTLSEQAVTVQVPEAGGEVMIVLNTPDQPSKVLSEPVKTADAKPADAKPADAKPADAKPADAATAESPGAESKTAAAEPPKADAPAAPADTAAKVAATEPTSATASTDQQGAMTGAAPAAVPDVARANALIKSVEADEKGRFFVSGTAEPGANIQIYLNDSPVASVVAAGDGTFGLAIEKGIVPGSYLIRVDDVEPASGKVLTRAEAPFVMEAKAAPASEPAAEPAPAAVVTADAGQTATRDAATPTPAEAPATAAPADAGAASASATAPSAVSETADASAQPAATEAGQQAVAAAEAQPAPKAEEPAAQTPVAQTPAAVETPAAETPKPDDASAQVAAASGPVAPAADASQAVIEDLKTVTVVRGDSLWRISRKVYGRGIRYTTIYDANTDQIRNPRLIYPGQVFVVPNKAPTP